MSSNWVGLAQPLYTDMPRAESHGDVAFWPDVRPINDACVLRVTRINMAGHVGTHVDAAIHFVPGGRSIDQYPLDKFHGPGIALDVRRTGTQPLDRAELDEIGARVRPGDIVLLSFGYGRRFGDEAYRTHPYLTVDAAEWFVEREVKIVGLDLMTPDLPERLRPAEFDWPVHQMLLGHDVLVMENLNASVAGLAGHRLDVAAVPMPIKGADGAPAAPIARVA